MTETVLKAEPGSHELSVTRDVAGSPELVYRCFVEPELMSRWLGPRQYETKVDVWDVRHGGQWRYVSVADGQAHGFRGVFHGDPSVTAGITQTWEYEGAPGFPSIQKATFEAIPTGTRITLTDVHLTVQARDMHLAAGMEGGMRESFERMDELLAGL